jgi:hypothetical protein
VAIEVVEEREEKLGEGGEEEERGARRRDKALEADATRTAGSLRFRVCVAAPRLGIDGAEARG